MFRGEGIGGAVFISLYTINLSVLIYGFSSRRIVFKSVFSFLLLHVCLRLAAQAVAIAIGTKGDLDFGLLIAYFVLGAEGYFSLVLCSYRFLIHHHQHTYPISGSWLEGKSDRKNKDPWYKRLRRSLTARDKSGGKDPWVMTWIHWLMIAANTIIIVGGTRVNGSDINQDDYWQQLHIANALRAVGQAIFLVINLFLLSFLLLSRNQDRNPQGTIPRGWTRFFRVTPDHGAADVMSGAGGHDGRQLDGYTHRMHPTLRVLFAAWPPLIVRGIFGLLQGLISPVNYANPEAYGSDGFTTLFVVIENVFAVLPEWTACCLLCTTIFTRETFNPDHLERNAGTHDAIPNDTEQGKTGRELESGTRLGKVSRQSS